MLAGQRKLQRKPSYTEGKSSSLLGGRANSLPHIHSSETEEELNRTTPEVLAGNAGVGRQTPVPRSTSITKLRGKVFNMGKSTPAHLDIAKGGPRPDTSQKLQVKRHKKGLSLQMSIDPSQKHGGKAIYLQWKGKASPFDRTDTVKMKTGTLSALESIEAEKDWEEVCTELSQSLKEIMPTDVRGQMRVYHRYFSIAVRGSGGLASLLIHLQEGYERLLDEIQEKYTNAVSKHQGEIIQLQNSILREAEDRKVLLKKIEKLSRENVEMSQACESYESKINEFQDKLFDIASVSLVDYPPSEGAWRLLNSELDYYKGWKKKAARELKITHTKEKKLIKLVHALKNRGFPVEEVYNSEVRTPVERPAEPIPQDENESQRLISGRPKDRPRPAAVPSLDLATVEPDLTSDSDSDDCGDISKHDITLRKAISDSSTHALGDLEKSERASTAAQPISKTLVVDASSL